MKLNCKCFGIDFWSGHFVSFVDYLQFIFKIFAGNSHRFLFLKNRKKQQNRRYIKKVFDKIGFQIRLEFIWEMFLVGNKLLNVIGILAIVGNFYFN